MAVGPLTVNCAVEPFTRMTKATDFENRLNVLQEQLEEARDLAELNQLLLSQAEEKLANYAKEALRAESLISSLLEQLEARKTN
jgi:hypothetical protein